MYMYHLVCRRHNLTLFGIQIVFIFATSFEVEKCDTRWEIGGGARKNNPSGVWVAFETLLSGKKRGGSS